jgi:hypothetical protein
MNNKRKKKNRRKRAILVEGRSGRCHVAGLNNGGGDQEPRNAGDHRI